MQRFLGLVLIVIGTVVFSPNLVEGGGAKVGIVDLQKIMRESQAAKDARGMFLLDIEAKRGVLKSREKEVRAMQQALMDREGKETPSTISEEREELGRSVKELKRLRDDMEEELKKKEQELRRTLLREITEIVRAYTKKNKYTIVLEKKMAVAFDESADSTDDIVKMYNEEKR